MGPGIRIALTEWNLSQNPEYPGWTTDEALEFYRAMLRMFRRHGVWLANQFLIASNNDALDMIDQQGNPQAHYLVFREMSLADPARR